MSLSALPHLTLLLGLFLTLDRRMSMHWSVIYQCLLIWRWWHYVSGLSFDDYTSTHSYFPFHVRLARKGCVVEWHKLIFAFTPVILNGFSEDRQLTTTRRRSMYLRKDSQLTTQGLTTINLIKRQGFAKSAIWNTVDPNIVQHPRMQEVVIIGKMHRLAKSCQSNIGKTVACERLGWFSGNHPNTWCSGWSNKLWV